mmetsp:Transcript_72125/g.192381  ORF Transcript_72125/g.192381 Transcript_72125/m.192381 type:complete len:388 (+) Transcript_72125:39-1202(+)
MAVQLGTSRLTPERLKKILASDRRIYYRTPELNEKLHIVHGGYSKLEHLEPFTGLKCLHAENNSFDEIQGLDACTELRSLFLQDNCISHMSGLEKLSNLMTLNLSSNLLCRVEGLANLPALESLNVSKNRIGLEGVHDVVELKTTGVRCLDLSSNRIGAVEVIDEVFSQMPALRVLYLKENPLGGAVSQYRKTMLHKVEGLKFLDDRPVDEQERRCARAFFRGGAAEEREERRRIKDEKEAEHTQRLAAALGANEEAKLRGREKQAMLREDRYDALTDPTRWGDKNRERVRRLEEDWAELEEQRRVARSKLKDDDYILPVSEGTVSDVSVGASDASQDEEEDSSSSPAQQEEQCHFVPPQRSTVRAEQSRSPAPLIRVLVDDLDAMD